MKKHGWVLWALLAGLTSAGVASAESPEERHPGRRPPRAPPTEAINACNGLQDGATCGFTLDGAQHSGVCRAGPDGRPAACMPDRPPPHHRGPPPEALAACNGLQAGATCSFSHDGQSLSGQCLTGPQGELAACVPARGTPPT